MVPGFVVEEEIPLPTSSLATSGQAESQSARLPCLGIMFFYLNVNRVHIIFVFYNNYR